MKTKIIKTKHSSDSSSIPSFNTQEKSPVIHLPAVGSGIFQSNSANSLVLLGNYNNFIETKEGESSVDLTGKKRKRVVPKERMNIHEVADIEETETHDISEKKQKLEENKVIIIDDDDDDDESKNEEHTKNWVKKEPTEKFNDPIFNELKKVPPLNSGVCCICLEFATDEGDHQLCCLKCGHLFGLSCINTWLKIKKSCPVCMKESFISDIRKIITSGDLGVVNVHMRNENKKLGRRVEELKRENFLLKVHISKFFQNSINNNNNGSFV